MRTAKQAPGARATLAHSPLAPPPAPGRQTARAALTVGPRGFVRFDAPSGGEQIVSPSVSLAGPVARPRRTGFALAVNELGPTRGRVPRVLRAFPMGNVKTTKGTFKLTPDGCKRSIDWFEEYGNALVFDYEHCTFELTKNLAAGWVEQGNQWADQEGLYVGVDWLPKAYGEIASDEYRYFSPTFEYDIETGEILCLLPMALTNFPATMHMTPIAEQGLRALTARVARPASVPARVPLRAPEGAAADVETPAEPPQADPPTEGDAGAAPAAPATPTAEPGTDPTGPNRDAITMNELLAMLCALLGITTQDEKQAKAQVVASITKLNALTGDAVTLTGAKDANEALGVIKAWKVSHEKLGAVQTELTEAKKVGVVAASTAKIDKAIAELRCPPACREFALTMAENPTQLDAYLATLVPPAEGGGYHGGGEAGARGVQGAGAYGGSAGGAAGIVGASGAGGAPQPPTVPVGGARGPQGGAGRGRLSDGERAVYRKQGLSEKQINEIEQEGGAFA